MSESCSFVKLPIVAEVIPDAANAASSGANTVRLPDDNAAPSSAFATADFNKLKLAFVFTISAMVCGSVVLSSSLSQAVKEVASKVPNAIATKKFLDLLTVIMFYGFIPSTTKHLFFGSRQRCEVYKNLA